MSSATPGVMPDIELLIHGGPDLAIVAEVDRSFDDGDGLTVVRVRINANISLVMSGPTAEQLADALIEAVTDIDEPPIVTDRKRLRAIGSVFHGG